MRATPTLPGMRSPAERWATFHAANPGIYRLFRQFAGEAKAAGLRRFSAGVIRLMVGGRAATFADLTELIPLAEVVGRLAADAGPTFEVPPCPPQ